MILVTISFVLVTDSFPTAHFAFLSMPWDDDLHRLVHSTPRPTTDQANQELRELLESLVSQCRSTVHVSYKRRGTRLVWKIRKIIKLSDCVSDCVCVALYVARVISQQHSQRLLSTMQLNLSENK